MAENKIKFDIRKFRLFPKEYGVFTWIWLVYLAFPLFYLSMMPIEQSWFGFVMLIVFFITYCWSFWDRKRLQVYVALLMLNIFAFCYLYHPNYYYMIFFTTFLISQIDSKSLRWVHTFVAASIVIFMLVIVQYWEVALEGLLIQIFVPFVISVVMPYGMWSYDRSRLLKKQLHSANDEIERLIKNQERQRIARDLHDTLGHTLSLITLKSELAGKLIMKDPERAALEIHDIQQTSRTALKQLRDLLAEMHTVTLEGEIKAAEELLRAAEIRFDYQGDVDKLEAVPLVRNMLALCLREAINNVVKHSQARLCTIHLVEDCSELRLVVTDDGIGLGDQRNEQADRSKVSGRGIIGIQERLSLIEGKLQLERLPQGGTLMSMIVPRIVKGTAMGGTTN